MDKYVVYPQSSILECMRCINESCQQLVPVVENDGKLVGVVADGDIRRAILRNPTLDQEANGFMSHNPIVINLAQWDLGKALFLMREKRLRCIPVVDEFGRFQEMLTLERLIQFQARNTPVVIMAGGLGSRLAPLTDEVPKPMLPMGGHPLLEYIVNQFIRQGFRRFIFSVNYKKEVIRDYFGDGAKFGASIHYIEENMRLGTAGALTLLPADIESPFIVMNGDILTTLNFDKLIETHIHSDALATMAIRSYKETIPYGVVSVDEKGYLANITEKPHYSFNISAGINVLAKDILSLIPENKFFDMPDLYKEMVENQKCVKTYILDCYWRDIGNIKDYNQAKKDILDLFIY